MQSKIKIRTDLLGPTRNEFQVVQSQGRGLFSGHPEVFIGEVNAHDPGLRKPPGDFQGQDSGPAGLVQNPGRPFRDRPQDLLFP